MTSSVYQLCLNKAEHRELAHTLDQQGEDHENLSQAIDNAYSLAYVTVYSSDFTDHPVEVHENYFTTLYQAMNQARTKQRRLHEQFLKLRIRLGIYLPWEESA